MIAKKSSPDQLHIKPAAASQRLDLAALAITDPSMVAEAGGEIITSVPVRKPGRAEFIRVNPDPETRGIFHLYTHQINIEKVEYLVAEEAFVSFPEKTKVVELVSTTTRHGDFFFWPVTQRKPHQSKENEWNKTARATAKRAEKTWLRMSSNLKEGYYDATVALDKLHEPIFPDKTKYDFNALLHMAFDSGRVIMDRSHSIYKELEGRI
jgi:hypothetical protein